MEAKLFAKVLLSLALVGVCSLFIHLFNTLLVKPGRLRSKLQRQGIKGPSPSFLIGNLREMKKVQSMVTKTPTRNGEVSHDWVHTLFPFFKQWKKDYGAVFMCSIGNIQVVYVSEHEMVKEISLCTSLDLGKPMYLQRERGPLLGQGILSSNGQIWAHHRKIIGPELYMDKVKGMVNVMVETAISLVNSWESKIESKEGIGDIRVDEDLRSFSADIISKTSFGSSYDQGKEIFVRLRALQQVMSKNSFLMGLPGLRYLPTKNNRQVWRINKEIRSLILEVVEKHKQGRTTEDLLQMIIEGACNSCHIHELGEPNNKYKRDNFIVDNCKNIYFAGYETTAKSICWTLVLLASNPDWQARVRAEVLQACAGKLPEADALRNMKLLTMVIQESLRLYPTVIFMSREALKDMKFRDIHIPKGVNLWIPVVTLHRDSELWGEDANEFNPERFVEGTAGACKLPHTYLPFGAGPRICAGQFLAMAELKIALSIIISKLSFSISPMYRHSPVFKLVTEPEHGINLLFKRVDMNGQTT